MKLRTIFAALLMIALFAGPSMAQQGRDYQPAGTPHSDATSFGYASVLRVTPVWETYRSSQPEQVCEGEGYYQRPDDNGRTAGGTVIGALVGGALGNTLGKGDGRKAATIAGAVAGGVIGNHIASSNSNAGPSCHMVDGGHVVRRTAGFDVEYNYKGDIYVTRMAYDPGNRVRVRVTVVPDDRSGPSVGY